ncbi:ABC-2 family transporter protein [Patescibacteria group bacterium]|nr:ABC-2 family transporter protein [Patescibacteria group bacterium]MBU0776828.1 ABC-2 family transporter protein [Patescibacteria group bacterium]MBU0845597.1 ABC-2 family transporter protein [Patescibacteria group bacterium]MBU0922639.1 ABC-2 family transporter protein [Patescibacteria group bacterium]MBU1066690.1 ABC-2 family transporter protein [Patescibacteria group bacterium]
MKKYLSIFKISFAQEFAYRVNFIMWRVRNVLQILLVFFLWSTVFTNPQTELFGYNREKILTYVFGIFILRAIVLSSRAVDIAGEIARGDLTNYLLKPLNYIKYWFTRDISSKALNLSFATIEITILYFFLRPTFFIQTNPLQILLFLTSVLFAIVMFFGLLVLVNFITFWLPEGGWASQFLVIVIFTEFLSGAVFPIDILPEAIQNVLYALPFPYLMFFPLQVYLGKLSMAVMLQGLFISGLWMIVLIIAMNRMWAGGVKKYSAVGR